MELEKVYQAIINGKAMLITGSGAHVEVQTSNGGKFPSGIELAKTIYAACGIDSPENEYDLQDASDTFLERRSVDEFIIELKKMLLVGQIQQEHKELYSQPWQRVYTTNYDDVPLISTKDNVNTLRPITLNSEIRNDLIDTNYCVYINGYIGRLDSAALDSEFRLTGKSYIASDNLKSSKWGAVFAEDIETVDCIVIIGLSLDYDLDIKRFIYSQNVSDKTVFIEKKEISDDKKRKMARLGKVYPIGMKQFTNNIIDYSKKYSAKEMISNAYIFRSFDVNKKKTTWKKATSFEVYSLLMMGEYCDSLWHKENGKYTNLVYRKKVKEVVDALLNGCRVIYLHANLGNGKTVFVESLKHQLQKSDYQIYTLKEYYQGVTAKEIQYIATLPGKKIIIIENYYNYLNILDKFSLYSLDNIQFILTARTVLVDTRIIEANYCLKVREGQSFIVDLNKLSYQEIAAMNKILQNNGLWGKLSDLPEVEKIKHLRNKRLGNSEFQAILVDVVQSSNMKTKIKEIVSKIKRVSDSYYEVLILALLIKIMSLNLSADDISRIMEINIAFDASFVQNENVREILDFSHGKAEFKVKSAVTANMILKELDCNDTIIKVLVLTAKFANTYYSMNRYENVLKNIISYSHVKTFLLKSGQKEAFLINYYDSLKELDYYKENTFFWLQYAIACSNIGNYDLAQTYLDAAYSYFYSSEYTVPFQIDTQQARLYLLRIERTQTNEVGELFEKAHLLLMKPIVSIKDNEEKQIHLLKYYVKKSIQNRIPSSFYKTYQKFCGEAYNKISQFFKKENLMQHNVEFEKLAQNLLKNSIEKI